MPIIGILPSDYIPPILLEYVVIAGGGGGAVGGGGAGGMLSSSTPIETSIGQTHGVTIGAGGTRGTNGTNSQLVINQQTFITAIGGGGGASSFNSNSNGLSGGSGGGAAGSGGIGGSGVPGQGYAGGNGSSTNNGGGGGAGGIGVSASDRPNGGIGSRNLITGLNSRLAGGGAGYGLLYTLGGDYGGGSMTGAPYYVASPGVANTGGGGAAGTDPPPLPPYVGEPVNNGGSGVIYIRYPKEYSINASIGLTSNTYTLGSTYKVTRFTAGSGTFQFTVV